MDIDLADINSHSVAAIVQFGVLGPVRATASGAALSSGGPKQRAVLAMLIAGYGSTQSVDSIAEAVWGHDTPSNARRNVQTYVATLRSTLGEVIVKDSYGWRLDAERHDIDSLAFEDLYESARSVIATNPHRASVSLREALAMWHGHAFADVDLHGVLDGEIARLTELRTAAQTARIDADLALGRDADLVGEIEALLAESPFSERIRAQHMLALYRCGRQREALQSFATMREVLIEELGVEPSHELQSLEMQILEQDSGLAAAPLVMVTTRSVLVVDPGDAVDLGRLPTDERNDRLERNAQAIRSALVGVEADIIAAGSTSYVVTPSTAAAVRAAQLLAAGPVAHHLRLAIDSGEVVIDETRASGAPVTRAAVLAAVANEGQVLLTRDAQLTFGGESDTTRYRFETLGPHKLQGIDGETQIYQLLVDDQREFGELQLDRLPPALPSGLNQAVPGYELRESFGVGSIGVLHSAFQPSVGREVVVEVIGRKMASDATFVRNFEADAQRLALFDHQNIAPVIDYWRRPEGAFIVYPSPRGGTLADDRSVDAHGVLGDVAAALGYAHSFGMVHGSLRPDRVLLDDVGNASLVGFQLARVLPTISTDFPAYAAPESLTGGAMTTQTDIFALGVLAHELLTGQAPPDRPLEAEHHAISKATAEDPAARYESVADFMAEFEPPRADQPSAHSRYTKTRNPYKGLAAFHERDAGDFFGRSEAVDELVEALSRSAFLAILGPSGVGKSSVARAGLVPALRAGALPGAEDWMITDMVPGSHPFTELKRALQRVAIDMPARLGEAIAARSPDSLAGVVDSLPDQSGLMIIVDQFEELFTLTGKTERAAFLDLITATARRGDVRFVITLRADFADRPLGHSEFAELFRRNVVLLRAPNREELEEAILRPAEGVGLAVESGLMERIVSDVHEQSGALPLLQHALAELFDARESDMLTTEAYDNIGRIDGALARRADDICSRLDPEALDGVRQAFLRLTSMTDDGRPTRRRARSSDLTDLAIDSSLDAFVRSRLLVVDSDPETRSPTIEVAHEALLTEWPTLAAWIDSVRDDLMSSRRLTEASREWESNERENSHLLTGGRLEQLGSWITGSTITPTEAEREFVRASHVHEGHVRGQKTRRRRTVMAGFAAAAIIASALGVLALQNARQARQNADVANAETLAANAIIALDLDPELSLLLATEALDISPAPSAVAATHRALQRDRSFMYIDTTGGPWPAQGAIDPEGRHIAVMHGGGSRLEMREVGGESPIWDVTLTPDPDAMYWGAIAHFWFSEDGSRIFVPLGFNFFEDANSSAVGIYTVDAANGIVLDMVPLSCLVRATPAGGSFATSSPLFAFDAGAPLAGGSCDGNFGRAGVVDLKTREVIFETPLGPGSPPSLSLDGTRLAASAFYQIGDSGEFRTRVLDTTTGRVIFDEDTARGELSSDGSRLLSGADPTYLFDVDSGERLQSYQGNFSRFFFTHGGARVIGMGGTGEIVMFDTETGAELTRLLGHTTSVLNTSIDAAGSTIVSSGFDGLRVWDVASPARGDLPSFKLPATTTDQFLPGALTSTDGLILVHRGSFDQSITDAAASLDTSGSQNIFVLSRDGSPLRSGDLWTGELGPNGLMFEQRVVARDEVSPSGIGDATLVGAPLLVNARTGEIEVELVGCQWFWLGKRTAPELHENCGGHNEQNYVWVSFAADGSSVVATTKNGAASVWDTRTGALRWSTPPVWPNPNHTSWPAVLSPDGQMLVGAPNAELTWEVIDLTSGASIAEFELEGGGMERMHFDDVSGLIVGGASSLWIIDPDTWQTRTFASFHGASINGLAVSPDGATAATVGRDEVIRVIDLADGSIDAEIVVEGGIGNGLRGVGYLDASTIVVAPEKGDELLAFTLDLGVLKRLATESLGRGFREDECATYNIDPCPIDQESIQP